MPEIMGIRFVHPELLILEYAVYEKLFNTKYEYLEGKYPY